MDQLIPSLFQNEEVLTLDMLTFLYTCASVYLFAGISGGMILLFELENAPVIRTIYSKTTLRLLVITIAAVHFFLKMQFWSLIKIILGAIIFGGVGAFVPLIGFVIFRICRDKNSAIFKKNFDIENEFGA